MLALDILQLTARAVAGRRATREFDAEPGTCAHNDGPFDDVPQLADVPRPSVPLKREEMIFRNRVDFLAKRPGELIDESPHERGTSSGRSRSGGTWI